MLDLAATFDDSIHDGLRAAADAGPVVRDPVSGATVVLRHADVERLAFDARLAGVGLQFFDFMGIDDGPLRRWYGSLMFTNEGETHHRLRKLVARAFTPRAVEALRDEVARVARDALAPVATDGGDLVAATAAVPMRAMCRLLGVPDEDVEVFWAWAEALSPVFALMDAGQVAAATEAIGALLAYVDELAARRAGDPRDDLISALLAAEADGDRLSHADLCDMVANLIVGGHDTTASQLGCTLLTLLRHPAASEELGRRPELLPAAVTETIRFEPSIVGVPRTAIEDVEVGGGTVPAGGLILLSTAAANREPGVWTDPDVLDIGRFGREGTPRLLSFGAGAHFCLGAALARMTVEETVRAFVDLGPLEPAADVAPGAVAWRQVLGRSPVTLPVSAATA